MSVRVRDQKQTDIWFIKAITEVCEETGQMLDKRKKDSFYNTYAPIICNASIQILYEAELANNIMISKTNPVQDCQNRRTHFQSALGYLDLYESLINMFVSYCMSNGSYNKRKGFTFFKTIGGKIVKIRSAIIKILKSDLDRIRKIEKENIKNTVFLQMNAQKLWYENEIKQRKEDKKVICPIVFLDKDKDCANG